MQTQIKVLFYSVTPERAVRRRQEPRLAPRDLAQVGGRLQPRRRRLPRPRRDLRPGGRGPVAEHRPARLRQLPGRPLPPGHLRPRLERSQRRPPDDARTTTAGPRPPARPGPRTPGAGRARQPAPCGRSPRPHAGRGGRQPGLRVRPERPGLARTTPSRRPSDTSTCAAATGCTSHDRAGSTSGCGWRRSWPHWVRPTPRRRRVAGGPDLCHHRLRHGSRACPASSPACHRARHHRHGRAAGPDVLRRPGHVATSSATTPAVRPGCGPTSAPRCDPTTSPSGAATRPRATPARPSGPRPASRSARVSAGS